MKKRYLLIILVFTCMAGRINAQTPDWVWARSGGGMLEDYGNSIAVDIRGNVYTAGSFSDTADFDPGPGIFNLVATGMQDIFISKFDSSGNFKWARAMGSLFNDYASAIAADANGNVYFTGDFWGQVDFNPGAPVFNLIADTSLGWSDIFVSKFDSSGNFVWAKAMGSSQYDHSNSIAVNAAGKIYITGTFLGTADFDPGVNDYYLYSGIQQENAFVCILFSSGNFDRAFNFGETSFVNSNGQSIFLDGSGNIYCTGYFSGAMDFDPGPAVNNLPFLGSSDIYIVKLNPSANFIWAKGMGGVSSGGDQSYSITVDDSGNVYTTGQFSGTADFDPGPNTFDLVALGIPASLFISKLNSNGDFAWAKALGTSGYEKGLSVAVDNSFNVYIRGFQFGTIDVDPGPGIYNLTNNGSFLLALNNSGDFVWAKSLPADSEGSQSMVFDGADNLYVAGSFYTSSLICGPDTLINSSQFSGDIFIGKLALNITTSINDLEKFENTVSIYPNPATDHFTISIKDNSKVDIIITDISGKIIYKTTSDNTNEITVNVKNFTEGMYFIRIADENYREVKRLIVTK